MTRGVVVAIVASFAFTACVAPQKPLQQPPPAVKQPLLPGEVRPPVTRVFRLDVSPELAIPRGDLADVQGSAGAIRVGWFGANVHPKFAIGLSTRFVSTAPTVDESMLFIDMLGLYFRLTLPLAPRLKAFAELEPTMVGMHVDCGRSDCDIPNDEGNEFKLRAGVTGRGGGVYEVMPGRLDLFGALSIEQTLPDEGGWLSVGVGLTVHFGQTHAEMKRRQRWQQQQQQQGK